MTAKTIIEEFQLHYIDQLLSDLLLTSIERNLTRMWTDIDAKGRTNKNSIQLITSAQFALAEITWLREKAEQLHHDWLRRDQDYPSLSARHFLRCLDTHRRKLRESLIRVIELGGKRVMDRKEMEACLYDIPKIPMQS